MTSRRLSLLLAGLLVAVTPSSVQAQVIEQTAISEQVLPDGGGSHSGLVLSPKQAQILLARGAPGLALRLAEQALHRGGGYQATAGWTPVKVQALTALGRIDQALPILEAFPPHLFESQPELRLMLAESQLAHGQFEEARQNFSTFMLNHFDHPRRLEAQRGMGLTALAAGKRDEAELLLTLYSQEEQRPVPDAVLTTAMGQLAHLKGDVSREERYFSELEGQPLPPRGVYYQQRIEALAHWHLRNGRWQKGVALVEEGLQLYPTLELRRFYRTLLKQGLSLPHAKKRGEDQSVLTAVMDLMRGGSSLEKREAALDRLLVREGEQPVGLFEEGGVLAADSFFPHPYDPTLRLLLAKANQQLKRGTAAWNLLEGLKSPRADQLRLRILGAGEQPASVDLLAVLRQPLLLEGEERVRDAVDAMYALTQRRQVIAAALLRRQLSLLKQNIPVRRALRFQQAMDKRLEGELDGALTLYLELAVEGDGLADRSERDRLLPLDPLEAAARILQAQGAVKEAAELRAIQ
ncbi:MAG: hypothetical protein HQL72_09860 [Magnetococcales bacterium]|nr:hypothetical protein [Magnetococcales bacterium]